MTYATAILEHMHMKVYLLKPRGIQMVELLRCSCTVCYEIVKTLDLETLKFQDQVVYQENLHHIFLCLQKQLRNRNRYIML